jgi:hypothetical protein
MIFNKRVVEKELLLDINQKNVHSILGYKKAQTALTDHMKALIEECFSMAVELIDPIGVYITRRIKRKGKNIQFYHSKITIHSHSMETLLHNSYAAIFMAITIGPDLEAKIEDFMTNTNNDKALILDAIGSEAVESAAKSLNDHLISQARQAKVFLTTRFSPGYGDLPLSFQSQLHKELSLGEIGIKINKKHLLFPQKTITAILGAET